MLLCFNTQDLRVVNWQNKKMLILNSSRVARNTMDTFLNKSSNLHATYFTFANLLMVLNLSHFIKVDLVAKL